MERRQLKTDNQHHWLIKHLPFISWLRAYRVLDLPHDIVAGLTVATMLIPQSMAYALLAGLPPVIGLYTGVLPVLVYGLLSSTRSLTFGPTAITSVMVLGSISSIAAPNTPEFFQQSLTLALLLGIVYLIMGLLRLGFVVNYLSRAVLEGYVKAAALIIAISQINSLLGIAVPRSANPAEVLLQTILRIGELHIPTLLLGLSCILSILFFSNQIDPLLKPIIKSANIRLVIARSGSFITVILATLIVAIFHLDTVGINIIGEIPKGFPELSIQTYDFTYWQTLLPGALAIAFVGFMEGISTAQSLTDKRQEKPDANQELLAMGAANIAGVVSGGLASTTSISRSAVNHAAGAKTGLSSVIAACIVGLTVAFFTPIFYYLPSATLAAIILTSVLKLIDTDLLRHLWQYSRLDTIPFFVTFFVTFFISIPLGIASGIAFSVLSYLIRTSRPEVEVLGRVNYTEHYRDISQFPEALPIPRVLIIRIDESLYFANAQYLDRYLRNTIAASEDIDYLILVCDAMNWLDANALQILEQLIQDLQRVDVTVYITQVNVKVHLRIKRAGFLDRVGTERFFDRTHDAVLATGTLLDDELPI
jgi:SulP family sulfate permease